MRYNLEKRDNHIIKWNENIVQDFNVLSGDFRTIDDHKTSIITLKSHIIKVRTFITDILH